MLESPLDCKETQPVNSKGNQSWIFIRRTDVEAETPILWPPDVKNWLLWKEPGAGKDWRPEEKGDDRDGGMASPTLWTWFWVISMNWWWTGKPGVLQSMGSQRVWHDWVTEMNWTENLTLKDSGIWLQNCQRTQGNRLLEGTHTKKILCIPGPRGKEQWPHERLSQTCLVSVWRSPMEAWVVSCLLWG